MESGNGKKLLCITDIAGYGKVALSAMFPVLSHLGCCVYNLPTALVANTFCYDRNVVLDTTSYMKDALRVWKELSFSFDAVATGYMYSIEQAAIVRDYCLEQRGKGALIFSDPIMADEGELYHGLGDSNVKALRSLVPVSDYIVPNYTEACLLTGIPYKEEPLKASEIDALLSAMASLGARSVIVTSALSEEEGTIVAGLDRATGRRFTIPYEHIPVMFPGTGDIFSSVFIGRILGGSPIEKAALSAMKTVYAMIEANLDVADKNHGIRIEASLGLIDRMAPENI